MEGAKLEMDGITYQAFEQVIDQKEEFELEGHYDHFVLERNLMNSQLFLNLKEEYGI